MSHDSRSNFDMLHPCEMPLWRLGVLAERYFAQDPNTSLRKLRQLSELLAQSLAAHTGRCACPSDDPAVNFRPFFSSGAVP